MIYPGERFTNPSGEGGFEFKRLFDGQGPLSAKDVEAFGNEPKHMMGETITPWFVKEIEKRFRRPE